jgi:diadenosine tetraphosphate (Ap4A) HIT family hydrolase
MFMHKHLLIRPLLEHYNPCINVREEAGQLIPHLHVQLFPRRESGPGVVTAMGYIL